MLHHLTDVICYGAINPCTQCHNGRFVFQNSGYACHGDISEWVQCDNFVREPERRPTVIPEHIQGLYTCLAECLPVRMRLIRDITEHSTATRDPCDSDVEDTPDARTKIQKVEIKSKVIQRFTLFMNLHFIYFSGKACLHR